MSKLRSPRAAYSFAFLSNHRTFDGSNCEPPQPTFLERRRTHLLMIALLMLFLPSLLRASCSSPANAIEAENCLTGTPASTWDISGVGDSTIQGFATDISFNVGQTVSFKISTNATSYRLDIYRMGYYQGRGARLITSVNPSVALPQNQPA